jgi:4'-phosphopantetheinyl transferase
MSLPCLWISEIPSEAPPSWESLLGSEELERYQQSRLPKRRLQFLATRVLLRRALAAEFGGEAKEFKVTARMGEAPRLLESPRPLYLSLAHTSWASAVLIAESACGVDIEDSSIDRDFKALAKTAFDASEMERYEKNPGREGFYGLWCAKEARYKAGQPCAWEGRLSYKKYRIAAALPLTGLKNLVIC